MTLFAIAFLCVSATLQGSPQPDVSSRVVDSNGKAIANAKVVLVKAGPTGEVTAAETTSAANGSFERRFPR